MRAKPRRFERYFDRNGWLCLPTSIEFQASPFTELKRDRENGKGREREREREREME